MPRLNARKSRRRPKQDLDPEFKPAKRNCDAWLCSGPSRIENSQETSSEISDFLDLEDEMFADLDLFEGVDSASTQVSVGMEAEFIGAVAVYSAAEEVERPRTPVKKLTKEKRVIEVPPRESPTSATSSRAMVLHDEKNTERKASPEGGRKGSKNTCPVCEKSFQQLGHLRSHLLLHTGERPFVCEICGKSFAQSGHLISHTNSHTSNRPYRCDFCDKTFTQSGHKRNHERSHLGIRPYECVHCDKKFTQSGHLVNHLRIHNGEKPYKCDFCTRSFTQSGHLRSHLKTHNNY